MNDLAPIVIFTYKRQETLQLAIQALKKCTLANESDVIIFSDAANGKVDLNEVEAVRSYLETVSGFKNVDLRMAAVNKGLANSIINGVSEVIVKHGKVIVLEDDLIVSKNFLVYINKALDYYKDRSKVFSISGYSIPVRIPENYQEDIYFMPRASSWGWATWSDRWEDIDWEVKDYPAFKNDKQRISEFNLGGIDMADMLARQMKGTINSWAIRWCYHQFKNETLTVYPTVSKIQNIGFSDQATHSNVFNRYKTIIDNGEKVDFKFSINIESNKDLLRQFQAFYSLKVRIYNKLKTILFKAGILKNNTGEEKSRILFILHLPPPVHGASLIGAFIKDSDVINKEFETDYLNLTTAASLNDIGKSNFRKLATSLKLYVEVFKKLISNRQDLVLLTITSHGSGFYKDFIVVLILKIFNRKIIYLFNNKGVAKSSSNKIHRFLYSIVFKNTNSIVNSLYLKNDISMYVPNSDIHVCGNGIPDIATLPGQLILNQDQIPKLLFLSNMLVEKGVFVLLSACKMLMDKGHVFKCDYVGNWADVNEDSFNDEVYNLGLTHHVVAHGKKYGDEKLPYFDSSDIFIFPTYYHNECFPLVLLEAMQFGLPIISTPEGGIRDIVAEGETGFLVEQRNVDALADKIEKLIINPQLRKQMGAAARRRYEQFFTLQKFENNLSGILKEALSHKLR